jgi:sucrose phosphorylase
MTLLADDNAPNRKESAIYKHLSFLYGAERATAVTARLESLLQTYRGQIPVPKTGRRFDESDAILITYGDMVRRPGERPLQTLGHFVARHLQGVVSGIHLLPFFPYSSDDGFSVIDYKTVDPNLGDWKDVARIGRSFRLMFDAVVNHISAQSDWFQGFLQGDPRYRDYFTVVEPDADLSAVFRPRALPLLTPVNTPSGVKHVWTTFSSDQVDLNYANPDVLLAALDVLLFYVARGAEFIRLDAIAFIWKELGTSCLHRPQAHRIIQLMRAALDEVAPQVTIITETNVPHEENVAYFGDGRNEAQMVYNFPLPPLTLHTFHTGNAEILSRWAGALTTPSDETAFFNFLASHDGIGVTPARGLLSDAAINRMAQRVEALGGFVSYKDNGDGSKSAYELNINYLDALGDPERPDEDVTWVARRFLASQAIMLALRGVPGIYFHSLFGSRGWREGVAQNGRFRTINRQKLKLQTIEAELADSNSLRHHVFYGYRHLLQQRAAQPAFDPHGEQGVLFCHESVFALWRATRDGRFPILCLHNVANHDSHLTIDLRNHPFPLTVHLTDLVSRQRYPLKDGQLGLTLTPYQILWLTELEYVAQHSLDL